MPGRKLEIDQELLAEVVARVQAATRPDRIILFGSAATGTMDRDSDLDILVLMDNPGNPRLESIRIRKGLGDLGWPIDVLVMDTKRFDETRDIVGGLAYPAHRYGRVLYAVS
ncbi:MAG: nucleotidyltransferase domain-containing protein [Candidatus Krumholzibacteriia bacterium]